MAVATVVAVASCTAEVPVTTVGPTSTTATTSTVTSSTVTTVIPSSEPPPPTALLAPPPTILERQPSDLPDGVPTRVESVVDGDTIVVTGGERVRLIGVDTPETKDPRKPVQCFGVEASAFTASLLSPGTGVRLVYDVERLDRFSRTLAYVYREDDGLFVNAVLLAEGYAQVATFPPNVAHVEEFTAQARTAREEGRGLWSACGGDEPASPAPATTSPVPVGGGGGSRAGCDPSYPDVCLPPAPPDLDCDDITERRFRVLPPDPHRFDGSDDDGLGCEG